MSNYPDNVGAGDRPWDDDQWFDSAEWFAEQWMEEECQRAYDFLDWFCDCEEERLLAAQAERDYPGLFTMMEVSACEG